MLLSAGFGCSNRRRMTNLTVDSQFFHQEQKPLHRSGRFDAYSHRTGKSRIKLPHAFAFVRQSLVHDFPVAVSNIAKVCWRACKSHPIIRISASFVPSTVGVNTEQFTQTVARPTSLWHQSGLIPHDVCDGSNLCQAEDASWDTYCTNRSNLRYCACSQ